MGQNKNFVVRSLVNIADDPDTLIMDAAAESVRGDISDLDNVTVFLVQDTDPGAGTSSLQVQYSPDGTTFVTHATKADTDFAAANGAAIAVSLSDANGMPIVAKEVRVVLAALSAGGVYSAKVCGRQVA